MAKNKKDECCAPKPKLAERRLMTERDALEMEAVFKVLANGTRLRLLHALLKSGELCVGDLANSVGMRQQAVSNQLQRMGDRGIVEARRDGLQMFYRIVDPCIIELVDRGWCLTEDAAERVAKRPGDEGKVA